MTTPPTQPQLEVFVGSDGNPGGRLEWKPDLKGPFLQMLHPFIFLSTHDSGTCRVPIIQLRVSEYLGTLRSVERCT